MRMSVVLLAAALLAPSARADAEAEAEHEARAQKMLSDSLVDAMAMLEHGSETAKEQAARSVAQMAIETTISQPFHPVTFRNACVRAGIIKQLATLLKDPNATPTSHLHALHALEAIATDDPTTDVDNGHAQAVCNTGVCPTVVSYLASADEALQVSAARCAAILAEDPQCQQMLVRAKAVDALVFLGTYGNDMAKMHAVAALDLLRLNNAAASKQIRDSGGMQASAQRVPPRSPPPSLPLGRGRRCAQPTRSEAAPARAPLTQTRSPTHPSTLSIAPAHTRPPAHARPPGSAGPRPPTRTHARARARTAAEATHRRWHHRCSAASSSTDWAACGTSSASSSTR